MNISEKNKVKDNRRRQEESKESDSIRGQREWTVQDKNRHKAQHSLII